MSPVKANFISYPFLPSTFLIGILLELQSFGKNSLSDKLALKRSDDPAEKWKSIKAI